MATVLAQPLTVEVPEEWRDAIGYTGRYQVSNLGRVWSLVTNRILRPAPTSKGYLTVNLYDGSRPKKPKSHCVHDLVMAAFVGPKPHGLQVDHGRKGKQCNAADNLEYVTGIENVRRAAATVRRYRGADHINAKLDARGVRLIRRVWPTRKHGTAAKLARRLGVDPMTVFSVGIGRSYKEIT